MRANQETILVVDDNLQISNFLVRELLPSLGYKTLAAHTGKAGLELLRANQVSLMLLDMQLPDFTGLDLLRQLAKEGRKIPTILFTAHGSLEIAVDAFRLGVQDYLTKPVDAECLNAAISRALNETRLIQEKELLTNRLKEQVTWLKVLSKVGQSVTSSLNLDDVLKRIVEAGVHLTHAEEGFLALLDNPSNQLYLRAVKNIDEEKSKTLRLPVNDSLVGKVLQTRRPIRTMTKSIDQSLKVSTGFLVHSLLHVPLITRGRVFGVLSVDNQISRREFSDADENILLSLADYAAVAIENANLFEQAHSELRERKRTEQALRESERRYELAARGANDGIWDWDLTTNQIYFSSRWKAMLGYEENEIGNTLSEWFDRVHPEDLESLRLDISSHTSGVTSHFEKEFRMLHKDGTYLWMLARGMAVQEKEAFTNRMAGSLTDITLRKITADKLRYDAFHDALTNLANRALFIDRLNLAVERSKRRKDYTFAVLFLDLDRFKDVNDSLGHSIGDKLIIAVSQLLAKGLRSMDTVARLGGDEFVILLDDIKDLNAAVRVANWIQKELTTPLRISDHEILITASIGIVLSTIGYNQPEHVLRDADIAMYYAKSKGKARYEIFEPPMRERVIDRLTLETELRQGLEHKELEVYYQPIVLLDEGKITGFEALLRWRHPSRGLLSPGEFMPVAEESGLIIPIDRWVIREACRQMREWQDQIPQTNSLTMSINLSGKHISQPDIFPFLQNTLRQTGLEPSCLKIELTENSIIENNHHSTLAFEKLKAMGVQIQIDDFGVGYSSLSYLTKYPIDALKIDQSFVNQMDKDGNQMKIIQAIVNLTHRLGVDVIAEGIETNAQLDELKGLECKFGQGYLIYKPLDKAAIKLLLSEMYTDEQTTSVSASYSIPAQPPAS